MKLRDLDGVFLRCESSSDDRQCSQVDALAEADGIRFLCPKCFEANGKSDIGVHSIVCWRPRVAADWVPGPGRWEFLGTGLDDLTLVAGSSSIALQGGCAAHFFVRVGEIVNA